MSDRFQWQPVVHRPLANVVFWPDQDLETDPSGRIVGTSGIDPTRKYRISVWMTGNSLFSQPGMFKDLWLNDDWIPAYAGMTTERSRTQLAPAPAYCIEILRHI
ncbi:MAG: hypothetical protein WBO34_01245 [Gammaproteobacteria bacterium]